MNATIPLNVDELAKKLAEAYPKESLYIAIAMAIVTFLAQLGTWAHLGRLASSTMAKCVELEQSPRPVAVNLVGPRSIGATHIDNNVFVRPRTETADSGKGIVKDV